MGKTDSKGRSSHPRPRPRSRRDAHDEKIEALFADVYRTALRLGIEFSLVVRRKPAGAALSSEKVYSMLTYDDGEEFIRSMDRCRERVARNPATNAMVSYSGPQDFGKRGVSTGATTRETPEADTWNAGALDLNAPSMPAPPTGDAVVPVPPFSYLHALTGSLAPNATGPRVDAGLGAKHTTDLFADAVVASGPECALNPAFFVNLLQE